MDRVVLNASVMTSAPQGYSSSTVGLDGRPTGEALADFSNRVAGALNATTLGLSAQTAMLIGEGSRLPPRLQESILGSRPNSLASRIGNLVDSGRAARSPRLFQAILGRRINMIFGIDTAQGSNYLRLAPLDRLAGDPRTGRRVGLSQYLGDQASQQINNTFGTLANSVGTNVRSSLFDETGVFNPQGVDAFRQQYGDALRTAGYQVNNLLSVFPNSSSLRSQVQAGLFGDNNSGADGVAGAPFTAHAFNTGFLTQFTNAYQNFTNPIDSFLGYQTNVGTGSDSQLPGGFFQGGATFPGLIGDQYCGTSFNNGFNNSFGPGFNNFMGYVHHQYAFTIPTSGTGFGTGTIDTGTIGTGSTGLGGTTLF